MTMKTSRWHCKLPMDHRPKALGAGGHVAVVLSVQVRDTSVLLVKDAWKGLLALDLKKRAVL